MKLTNETLRAHYLEDLKLPDSFHGGRVTPKVKYFKQWESIEPFYANGTPMVVDPWGDRDIWVISDPHFYHKNIIKYTNRPYPTTELMNECLVGNYINVVKHDDIVIWNGDIGFASENKINEILNKLPGYKIHVIGNHDITREGKVMKLAMDEQHLCYVVDVIDHDIEFQLLFTHYPLDDVPQLCVSVCGHIHNNTANPWNIVVCVEHTNYTPMNLKDIIKRAKTYLEKHQ